MEILKNTIQDLTVFIIFSTVIKNLIGKNSYGKYVDFFMGLVLIIILTEPISKLFFGSGSIDYLWNQNNFKLERAQLESELNHVKERQEQVVLEDYKRRILEQVKEVVEKKGYFYYDGEIIIMEGEKEYGKIDTMQIWVSKEEKKKIEIKKIKLKDTNLEEKESEKIRKELKKIFQLEGEQINIYLESR